MRGLSPTPCMDEYQVQPSDIFGWIFKETEAIKARHVEMELWQTRIEARQAEIEADLAKIEANIEGVESELLEEVKAKIEEAKAQIEEEIEGGKWKRGAEPEFESWLS
jgi:hypothetical protein